jgi:hypothetical protein
LIKTVLSERLGNMDLKQKLELGLIGLGLVFFAVLTLNTFKELNTVGPSVQKLYCDIHNCK